MSARMPTAVQAWAKLLQEHFIRIRGPRVFGEAEPSPTPTPGSSPDELDQSLTHVESLHVALLSPVIAAARSGYPLTVESSHGGSTASD